MATSNTVDGYALLVEMSRRYGEKGLPLPAQREVIPTRTVLCFHLLNAPVAVILEEVSELFEVPHCTRLPRAKPWVKGVANVRGKLTTIVDFAAFLGGKLCAAPKRQRVIMVERDGVSAGLIVDDVAGMKHFRVDAYSESRRDKIPVPLAPFVSGTFFSEGECWSLFRPEALLMSSDFQAVAA